MSEYTPFLITGVISGSLYGLTALGLVITYRTSGVFNFGHGAIAAASAYVFYSLHHTYGLPWPLAVVLTVGAFAAVGGFLLERITRVLGDAPDAVVVVATVGVLLATNGLINLGYGPLTRHFPAFLPESGFTLAGVAVSWAQCITFVVAVVGAGALYAFLRLHRLGVAMRAVVDNPQLVSLTGLAPVRVRLTAWSIGTGFAALSGILLAPTLNLDVTILTLLVVQALGACAIGLFASLPLTFAGGILVGVVASLATKEFIERPWNGVPSAVPFLFLIVILLVVPARRFPIRRAGLRSLVGPPRARSPRATAATVLVVSAVLLAVPAFAGTRQPLWTAAAINVVLYGSLAILVWTSGQISLCHMVFVAIGAVCMSHFSELPWLVALLAAGLVAAPVGALVAIPAVRVSGIYLALLTLGFGILMQYVMYGTAPMFGRELVVSAPPPQLWFIDGTDDTWLYYVMLAVAAVVCASLTMIDRGRLGRFLRSMAESPTMLSTHGLTIVGTKVIVFSFSAFLAGIAGGLTITLFGSTSGVSYGPFQSLLLLAVLAICGTGTLRSPVLAAFLATVVPGYLTSFDVDRQTFVFGLAAIVAALLIARRPQLAAWFDRAAGETAGRLTSGPVRARWESFRFHLHRIRTSSPEPSTGAVEGAT